MISSVADRGGRCRRVRRGCKSAGLAAAGRPHRHPVDLRRAGHDQATTRPAQRRSDDASLQATVPTTAATGRRGPRVSSHCACVDDCRAERGSPRHKRHDRRSRQRGEHVAGILEDVVIGELDDREAHGRQLVTTTPVLRALGWRAVAPLAGHLDHDRRIGDVEVDPSDGPSIAAGRSAGTSAPAIRPREPSAGRRARARCGRRHRRGPRRASGRHGDLVHEAHRAAGEGRRARPGRRGPHCRSPVRARPASPTEPGPRSSSPRTCRRNGRLGPDRSSPA